MRSAWKIIAGAIVLAASEALGCPVCDSNTGQQVRAGVFDDDLPFNTLAAMLPFAILLGIVAVVHFGGGRGEKEQHHGN